MSVADDTPRARAFAYLSEIRRAASIDEIAQHLSLHPTGVRHHLARLEESGLVVRRSVRQGRGRPRYEWAVAPDAGAQPGRPEAQAQLASWLAGAVAAGKATHDGLEEYGCAIGRDLAPVEHGDDPVEAIGDVFAALGFRPEPHARDGVTTFELRNCPYRDAVRSGGRHVCALHVGMSRGLLERIAPGARLSGFVAKDPDTAGCLVEIEGLGGVPSA